MSTQAQTRLRSVVEHFRKGRSFDEAVRRAFDTPDRPVGHLALIEALEAAFGTALRREEWQGIETAGVVKVPRKLVEDVLTDYVMMAGTPRPDPLYARDVERLGSRIGYGAMMQSASASWSDTVRGGEFCVGPCRAVAISTRDRLAALLPPPPKGTDHE